MSKRCCKNVNKFLEVFVACGTLHGTSSSNLNPQALMVLGDMYLIHKGEFLENNVQKCWNAHPTLNDS